MVIDVYDSKGGGIVSTKRFTEHLRKRGHKVIVISTGKTEKDKLVLEKYYPRGFKRIMKKMKMAFAKPDEKKIKDVFKMVDVVHVQLPFLLGIKSITYAKELNLPVVTSFHVQAENITKNLRITTKRTVKMIYKYFLKKFYNRSDIVICPSIFAKKELKDFGLKSHAEVISNGFPDFFYPKKFKRKYNDKFVILSVGRLAIEKNHKLIIDAVSLSKYKNDIRLVIVGDGPLKNDLKKYARILKKVDFLGSISNEKLLMWYNTSDLYVHAGEVELEGMTVLEAMACSLPILVSNSEKSAAKQFAINEKSLFSDAKDLAKKIDYWYEHPEKLSKEKEKYLELSKKYNIHKSVKKLESCYIKAIKLNKKDSAEGKKDNVRAWVRLLKYIYKYIAKKIHKRKVAKTNKKREKM